MPKSIFITVIIQKIHSQTRSVLSDGAGVCARAAVCRIDFTYAKTEMGILYFAMGSCGRSFTYISINGS